MSSQLLWAPEAPPKLYDCVLVLDPVMGLMDVDFHRVTDEHWDRLKSARPGSAAQLIVAPTAPMQQVQQALETLRSKGDYREVVVTVRDQT